jgi:oligo-1,6-glucosidase
MQKQWWHDKVVYQIYPKSFYDSNGDGIGDLPGIIQKLDYLKDLGVDILWLSPIFRSPLADQGYDISDYYDIDPRFGTMADMEKLIEEAKKRDMHILMDLVVNHCSDEHEWFQKALEDPDGEYGKYFYIEEGKDGKVPCNWRSYFGGSVWEKIEGTNKYYLHFFHKKQPDLNWENETVRQEIYKMINWWLDKGLSGFRIDAIINIKKVLPFKDYEPDREDGMASCKQMLREAEGILVFLNEMRDMTFMKHDAFSVGEVFDEKEEDLPRFIGDDGCFSSMFDFNETIFGISEKGWYDYKQITPDDYRDCCFTSQKRSDGIGFLSNIIENHDEPRGVSRYIPKGECNEFSKKMLATFYFLLKGIPFIYQGQELGMENAVFHSIDEIDDISSLDEYNVAIREGLTQKEAMDCVNYYSRDNARTPFQWSDENNAGFSTGIPWLSVNPNFLRINEKDEREREDSVLNYYKKLIQLRKDSDYKDTFVYGTFEEIMKEERLMAYYRNGKEQKILIICNFRKEEREILLKHKIKKVLLNNHNDLIQEEDTFTLLGYQALVLEV